MENVRSYCDDILDVIHKFGEEYMTPELKSLMGKICLFLLIIISITILHTLMIRTIDRMRLV